MRSHLARGSPWDWCWDGGQGLGEADEWAATGRALAFRVWLMPTSGLPGLACTPDSADRSTSSLGHKAAKAALCTGAGVDVRLLRPGKAQHRRAGPGSYSRRPDLSQGKPSPSASAGLGPGGCLR